MAFALSHDAELLILDEPTAAWTSCIARAAGQAPRIRRGGDRTVLAASHITDGLDEIAEDIFSSTTAASCRTRTRRFARPLKWMHFKDGALPRRSKRLGPREAAAFGSSGLTATTSTCARAAGPLASGDVKLDNATLEDVLLSFIKGREMNPILRRSSFFYVTPSHHVPGHHGAIHADTRLARIRDHPALHAHLAISCDARE